MAFGFFGRRWLYSRGVLRGLRLFAGMITREWGDNEELEAECFLHCPLRLACFLSFPGY